MHPTARLRLALPAVLMGLFAAAEPPPRSLPTRGHKTRLAKPTSKRKAALLEKALKRAAK